MTGTASPASAVTIRNPQQRNALDDRTRRALLADLRGAVADASTRVVLVRGYGGTFCSGGEIGSMPTDKESIRVRLGEMHEIIRVIVESGKPVVAVVEGHAAGSGISIAAACDVVLAHAGALFTAAFTRIGLVPDTGLLWTLSRRLPRAGATRFAMLGEQWSASEAHRRGLVDAIADGPELDHAAEELVERIAALSPAAVGRTRLLARAVDGSLEDFLGRELDLQVERLQGDDFALARERFLVRRRPTAPVAAGGERP